MKNGSHNNVLIVDDEPDVRDLLKMKLQMRGIPADIAVTGDEAFEKASKTNYKVMLLDVRIPGRDGFEVMRDLKQSRNGLKIIVMTNFDSLFKKALGEGGADFAYLKADTSIDEIIEKVISLL